MHHLRLKLTILIVMAFIATVLIGPVAHAEGTIPRFTYAGKVIGSEDEFVGIGLEGDAATVYICDGLADKGTVSIAEWFIGKLENGTIDVTASSGNRVLLKVNEATAEGQFTFKNGTIKKFVLQLIEGGGGLFRSEFTFAKIKYVGGWLIFEGKVRGAVLNTSTNELVAATFVDFSESSQ
jgi:hypothetical protein